MKKILISLTFIMAIATNFAFAQGNGHHNNVRLAPFNNGNPNANMSVCYNTELYVWIAGGYSFVPVSYLWNTGETTPTIMIQTSGTYSVAVTGYLGQSQNLVTLNKDRYYEVGPNPVIVPLTALKVCKWQTVELTTPFANACGAVVEWHTSAGDISYGNDFQYTFNNTQGPPRPDTLHVWYVVTVNGCTSYSDTILIRSYRYTPGLVDWLCASPGRLNKNLTDSVVVGWVINYPLSDALKYRVQFTEVTDSLNVIITETAVGSKHVQLNVLESGKQYYVETWPVVNGVTYCSGNICTIGIKPAPALRLENQQEIPGEKLFEIFDLSGKLLLKEKAEEFNYEWFREMVPQMVIVRTSDNTGKLISSERKAIVW